MYITSLFCLNHSSFSAFAACARGRKEGGQEWQDIGSVSEIVHADGWVGFRRHCNETAHTVLVRVGTHRVKTDTQAGLDF